MRNGLTSLTLAWKIENPTEARVAALKAGLLSVAAGGTSSRTAFEIEQFLGEKGIFQTVAQTDQFILLTISAPSEVFPETVVHLENLLLEPTYSSDWYDRARERERRFPSSQRRRPAEVLAEVATLMTFPTQEVGRQPETEGRLLFGRPHHAIVRTEDEEIERRIGRLLSKLPTAAWELPFAQWAKLLTERKEIEALPKGVIHLADPDASEMMILFVHYGELATPKAHIGAQALMDYIGANQGSEMFRIIRQEMRAAYDPRSNFVVPAQNHGLLSFSATVKDSNWQQVFARMQEIYTSTRAGAINIAGLETQVQQLQRQYFNKFFFEPGWAAKEYLKEYPEGSSGQISIELFSAVDAAEAGEIARNAPSYLPPLDEFLIILMGGGAAPVGSIVSNGYCKLPKNSFLSLCISELSQ